MRVEIWLELNSQPIIHPNVEASYQKGDLLCIKSIRDPKPVVFKYPLAHIFCVRESEFKPSH